MGDLAQGAKTGSGREAAPDRLESWKEIAAYLKRDVRTVQRWERREGLPVHRQIHDKLGSVYAYRSEVDQWRTKQRGLTLNQTRGPRSPFASWKWILVFGSICILGVIAGFLVVHSKRPSLSNKDTILLADFSNTTGDPVFDDTLKTALEISLRQSPFLVVLPQERVTRSLRLMTHSDDTKLTPEVARELCQRTASAAYVIGSIGKLADQFVLSLKAVSCQTGETLVTEQEAAAKGKLLNTLGTMAVGLRQHLGESLKTVQQFDVKLEEATTPSLEALKAYSIGERVFRSGDPAVSLRYHELAIQLDPNFAMAHWAMGWDYVDLGEIELARRSYDRAMHLSERVSEPEKLEIAGTYYFFVSGELDRAERIYQDEIETYPKRPEAYHLLGNAYALQGQYSNALETTREGLRVASDGGQYESLGIFLLAMQQLGEARQAFAQALQKQDDGTVHGILYGMAFLSKDSAAMAEEQRWLAANNKYATDGFSLASDTEAYSGRLREARRLTRQAVDTAIGVERTEGAAIWQVNAALREAAFGNSVESKRVTALALKLAPDSQIVEVEAALAFAITGDIEKSKSLTSHLKASFPVDTQVRRLWLPTIEAQQALSKNDPHTALDTLQSASNIELALIPSINNFSCLYPPYIRGEAYLASGQGAAAAAEFQKIIDHGGLVWNCWTGALAHLGLARANALEWRSSQGAKANAARQRALDAYMDFLSLWKNADADTPILAQAKAEYAKLQLP